MQKQKMKEFTHTSPAPVVQRAEQSSKCQPLLFMLDTANNRNETMKQNGKKAKKSEAKKLNLKHFITEAKAEEEEEKILQFDRIAQNIEHIEQTGKQMKNDIQMILLNPDQRELLQNIKISYEFFMSIGIRTTRVQSVLSTP